MASPRNSEWWQPDAGSGGWLTWLEVLGWHGSRRGIHRGRYGVSVLYDEGLSGYQNTGRGGRLTYMGAGRAGDQTLTGGNALLAECRRIGEPVRVFDRLRPGCWLDRGWHLVESVSVGAQGGRLVYWFSLAPVHDKPELANPGAPG